MARVDAPAWRRTAAILTVTIGLFLLASACRAAQSPPLWKYALDGKLKSGPAGWSWWD